MAINPKTGRLEHTTLQVPGRSLLDGEVDTQLLSLSTLLHAGWQVDLNKDSIVTLSGHKIRLERRNGLWLLPRPPGATEEASVLLLDSNTVPPRQYPTRSKTAVKIPVPEPPASAQATPRQPFAKKTPSPLTIQHHAAAGPTTSAPPKQPAIFPSAQKAKPASVSSSDKGPVRWDLPYDPSEFSNTWYPQRVTRAELQKTFDKDQEAQTSTSARKPKQAEPSPDTQSPEIDENEIDEDITPEDDSDLDFELTLDRNLRLWDQIHENGHPKLKRMLLIAKGMHADDPNRPALRTLHKWKLLRVCGSCLQGAPIHPPRSSIFPDRVPETFTPGQKLYIDSIGSLPEDAPQADGTTGGILVTDRGSDHISYFPTRSQTDEDIIAIVQRYQAATGVKILHIQVDQALHTAAVQAWCDANGTLLTAAAPRGQHQNHLSELAVNAVKSRGRTVRIAGSVHKSYLSEAYNYAAQAHNRLPSSCDPKKLHRSPNQIWEGHPPFTHTSLQLSPFGCRCFPHVGKTTANPNVGTRAPAAVYLGHDMTSTSHRVLCLDKH